MNEAKKEQLSAFMDGEIDARGNDQSRQLLNDPELSGVWSRYHLISDCLQRNLPERLDQDLAQKVSEALAQEPAIVAPGRFPQSLVRPAAGFAIAASVAALAIFGVLQQAPQELPVAPAADISSGARVNAPVRQVSAGGGASAECEEYPTSSGRANAGADRQASGNGARNANPETNKVNCK